MPINPLGSGVSRYISDRDRQYAGVVFQASKPPLDSELNLISLIDLESKAEEVRSRVCSGWLMNESNPYSDFHTRPEFSNQFYFGRNTPGEVRNVSWAVVNGWAIPVAGTRTGQPPLAANNVDYWNKIQLSPPSTSTGGNRAEFVFLEVWLQRVDVDPAPPTVAPGKPQRGFIYKFGNVEGGFTSLPDELVDPDINYETTKRIQIQYRIRVVADVNLVQNPEGFDSTLVYAQGSLASPSVVPFVNMKGELGDPGLWRAGTGDPATFGTADGYVYAIPICSVFRRNSAGFSDVGNMAGAFSRNSKALYRTDATTYTSPVSLPSPLSSIATSFTLTSIAGTMLNTMSSFGEAYFKIDDEIIRVVSVIQVSPTNYTININRGQLNTIARSHNAGLELRPYTVRPDGLFADQVTSTDIMDMRHSVADKFDYDSILKTNVVELLKGNLRSTWKRWGTTNSAGSIVLYGDRVTDSSIFVGGLTRLDAPDGNRRTFSDAVTTQRFVLPVSVPDNTQVVGTAVGITVSPYTGVINWTGTDGVHTPGNRLNGTLPYWWNGDEITVNIAQFRAGLIASDSDQVRFIDPAELADAVLVRFEGMTTDPNGGDPIPGNTAPTVSNPRLDTAIAGKRILRNGDGLSVAIVGDNLVITLLSGTLGTPLQEFTDCIQGETTATIIPRYLMHVEFTVLYGSGRGLSHKPEWVHSVHYRGTPTNVTKTLTRSGLSTLSPMVPTYVVDSPLVQTGNDRQYSRTSEVMLDPGSKTAYIAPYRQIDIPPLVARDGSLLNWYGPAGAFTQGSMPVLDQDGSNTVNPIVDPLGLFYIDTVTRYVEIDMDYLPKPGLHHVPIVPVSTTVFSSGINFLIKSSEGPVASNSNFNRNYVVYPANRPGIYIATPLVGEVYGDDGGSTTSIFGEKVTIPEISGSNGAPFRGIRFPPFMGPARITGIYVRNGTALLPTSSPFSNDRVFIGAAGSDVNLLRDSYDGPTFLLDVNVNADLTFVLNAEVIDLSKAPAGTTFDNAEFLIECTLFGYDRGFLQTNGRILCARAAGSTLAQTIPSFGTYGSDNFSVSDVGLIVPAPLAVGASNNEVTFYYSRSPYQGDPFGTQNAYSDDAYRLGPMNPGEAITLANSPLGPVPTLTLPNKGGFEVLAATSFVTSLGTGRLSGSNPIPLLNTVEAPENPKDYAGTRVDLYRQLSLNRVGFDDWTDWRFPVYPTDPAAPLPVRPPTVVGAISEVFDNDVHPEFAGCVVHLPLGSYFRDKDFIGKTLYQTRSSNGNGSIPVGTLTFTAYEASMTKGVNGISTWEGRDFPCGMASNTSGVGSESLVRVDGTSNYGDTLVFKTTRGGAAYSATGPWPGGVITSRFIKTRPNTEVGSVLMCTAYLVRSLPEVVGSVEVHPGNELQMIMVTQAAPSYFRDNEIVHSASGTNEGYTAVDRFRILGKPLEKRRGNVRTDVLPAGKPLFVNKIYDNPLLYGSSDLPLLADKQESVAVASNGQTTFYMSSRPLDPTTVQMYLNGVKLQYGIDYTVNGPTNTEVTYYPNPPLRPDVVTTDIVEFYYLLF